MNTKEALREVFSKLDIGQVFTRQEIIQRVKKVCDGDSDVIPSDYCYNITNKQYKDNFKNVMHIFEYLGNGKYKYIGEKNKYSGEVTHKEQESGEQKVIGVWENGVFNYTIKETIDIKAITNFISTYAGAKYKKPDNAGDNKVYMQQLHDEGIYSRNQFIELGKEVIKPIDKKYIAVSTSSWVNQGQVVPEFFWTEFKKIGYKDCKSSISLFALKNNESVSFILIIETKDFQCNPIDFEYHNRIIYKPLSERLHYSVKCQNGEYKELDCSHDEIINRYEAGEFIKIQIRYRVEELYDTSQWEELVAHLHDGIKLLEPYYEEAIKGMNASITEKDGYENDPGVKIMNQNIILYGPPGTGKTYNTVLYAVAICDGKTLSELEQQPYDKVISRYKELKNDCKRIEFTTFHQSYGYEEFIEGIKPVMVEDELLDNDTEKLEYSIRPGVFKDFCERARAKKIAYLYNSKVKTNPVVWKVSLQGSKNNPTKTDCFDNNRIRIGWPDRDRYITDESEFKSTKERRILLDFESGMQIGDLVVILYDQFTIDAIGVIDGDYEWLEDGGAYPRCRKVKWLVKDIQEDIRDINHGKAMTSATIYRLNIQPGEILEIVKRNAPESLVSVDSHRENYIFIIDEINRGNISKIFGELITLIETTKREGAEEAMEANLPYSGLPFSIPNNVYILGTMNTADRSIALMDTALRRRFKFIEMMPKASVLNELGISTIEGIDIVKMLNTINERIEYLFDREHTIGHAYFTSLSKDDSMDNLADIFRNNIIPLLQEYFYEDYNKIQLVLGDNGKTDESLKFIKDTKVSVKNMFKGNVSEIEELADKKFEIQDDAFYNPESYKLIY